jgi:dTDP-4-dehydrorhamnose reductase
MRWLVTGAKGMLGRDLTALLQREGEDVVGVGRAELDVTDVGQCRAAVSGTDIVVNCAAYTDVDGAESDAASAFDVNATGAANLALAATEAGVRLVHLSTDYVFDGTSGEPYAEDDVVRPVSSYGRSKAAGEWAVRSAGPGHLVLRTAWLYGAHGPCFPRTIARLAGERDSVSVVVDQVGQPTWTVDVSALIVRLVRAGAPGGIYHATASGSTSWFAFAQEVVAAAGADAEVLPTTSAEFVRPAARPASSVLAHARLEQQGVAPIGPWLDRWRAAAHEVLAGQPRIS